MEKTVEEFKKLIAFKDETLIGDLVLLLKEESEDDERAIAVSYARVCDFVRDESKDESKKDEWWYVHLAFLTIPPQPQVLILQSPHFTGREIFTMGGKKVFIKALDFEQYKNQETDETPAEEPSLKSKAKKGGLKLVK